MALSKKHCAFVEEYLATFNATEAYHRVYAPRTRAASASNGYQLLRNAGIQKELERRVAEISGERSVEIHRHIKDKGYLRSQAKSTVLYLIREEHGAHKIGVTANIKARFVTLSNTIPYSLTLVMVVQVEDVLRHERELHSLFEGKRIKGEWFQLSDEDVEWIKRKYGVISKAERVHR